MRLVVCAMNTAAGEGGKCDPLGGKVSLGGGAGGIGGDTSRKGGVSQGRRPR